LPKNRFDKPFTFYKTPAKLQKQTIIFDKEFNMEDQLLFKGLIIGFSIAAPVGPIGVLCIRRTLIYGQVSGLLSGLGAATADAFYGAIAGFGLTFISALLLSRQDSLKLVGGLFLCYLGIKTLLAQPATSNESPLEQNLLTAYLSTFFLTLTNPATILSFMAIFAGLGLAGGQNSYTSAIVLVLGVFVGSALWWLALSGGVALFRKRFNTRWLTWVNWVSGIIIGGFGLLILASLAM